MSRLALRPKYQLNHMALEGSRTTIPARSFTQLTSRHYPYPRVGTRAPNGMFPSKANNPLEIAQEKVHYEMGNGNPVNIWRPHYTLNREAVQGVMPASTYGQMTGKLTTQPQMPRYTGNLRLSRHEPPTVPPYTPMQLVTPQGRVSSIVSSPYGAQRLGMARAPALQFDWGSFFWGAVGGGVVALAMVYGIIPALGEWAAAAIKARY